MGLGHRECQQAVTVRRPRADPYDWSGASPEANSQKSSEMMMLRASAAQCARRSDRPINARMRPVDRSLRRPIPSVAWRQGTASLHGEGRLEPSTASVKVQWQRRKKSCLLT